MFTLKPAPNPAGMLLAGVNKASVFVTEPSAASSAPTPLTLSA
jgi:hypothetical protein